MPEFTVNVSDNGEYTDIVVSVLLADTNISDVKNRILFMIAEELRMHSDLEIVIGTLVKYTFTFPELGVVFRFPTLSNESKVLENLSGEEREGLPRYFVQFVFHIFAKIDVTFPLAEVSLPPFFRDYLGLPEFLREEGYYSGN